MSWVIKIQDGTRCRFSRVSQLSRTSPRHVILRCFTNSILVFPSQLHFAIVSFFDLLLQIPLHIVILALHTQPVHNQAPNTHTTNHLLQSPQPKRTVHCTTLAQPVHPSTSTSTSLLLKNATINNLHLRLFRRHQLTQHLGGKLHDQEQSPCCQGMLVWR